MHRLWQFSANQTHASLQQSAHNEKTIQKVKPRQRVAIQTSKSKMLKALLLIITGVLIPCQTQASTHMKRGIDMQATKKRRVTQFLKLAERAAFKSRKARISARRKELTMDELYWLNLNQQLLKVSEDHRKLIQTDPKQKEIEKWLEVSERYAEFCAALDWVELAEHWQERAAIFKAKSDEMEQ